MANRTKFYNKYGNKKITVAGETFDSKKEYKRYCELKLLERAKIISNLRRQVKYILIPAQYEKTTEKYTKGARKGELKQGKLIERECSYIADFVYKENDVDVVEDTKGCKKGGAYAVFTIKRKLMLYKYGIKIKEL